MVSPFGASLQKGVLLSGNGWRGSAKERMMMNRTIVLLLSVALLLSVTLAARAESPRVRKAPPFPVIVVAPEAEGAVQERYEVLRGDFHIHTIRSDGKLTPQDRVRESWEFGFDVIAITDHRNFVAYEEALPVAEDLGMILIRGMETGLHQMEHLVALGFGPDYVPRDEHSWDTDTDSARVYYREQWPKLTGDGAFVLYAHPHVGHNAQGVWVAETGKPLEQPLQHKLRQPLQWALGEGLLHGIEIRNHMVQSGWGVVQDRGTRWYPMALDWAVEHGLTVFANSDVHGWRKDSGAPDEEESATLVLVRERSRQGVMEALRAGRTVGHFAGMLAAPPAAAKLLVQGLTDVVYRRGEEGSGQVRIENRGPVPLTARLDAADVEPVQVGAYQAVLVDLPTAPDELGIEWTNVLVRSDACLVTRHAPNP
jgi:3',5'-nucleoside bisphosphate phosphatase